MKSTIVEQLIGDFPELENDIRDHLKEFPEIYLHLIFGDIFNPFLSELLRAPQANLSQLIKAGKLLETMAQSDAELQEVVVTTVLERLSDDPRQLALFSEYAGPQTK